MENNGYEPIKIINILIRFKNAFLQMWALTVVLGVVVSAYYWYTARRSFVPMYESKAIFTVDSSYDAEDIFGTGTYYDQFAAQQMAGAFPYLISTDMMLDLVIQELGGYPNGSASAMAVAESNMLVLTVNSSDPQAAYDYLCAIMKYYPQIASVMVDNPQVKVVTSPEVAVEPKNSFNASGAITKGAFLGVGIGLIIILICGLLTRTVQTTEELKKAINIPILIALPKVTVKKRRTRTSNLLRADTDPNMNECFRGLRMKVKKLLEEPGKKSVLVTSTLAGEGKTTVAVNLALSLQHEGYKVLLLDADFRSQSVCQTLNEKPTGNNLMDCMRNDKLNIFDCIRTSKTYRLEFVSGKSTDKRHYALDAPKIRRLLGQLSEVYDYIVIDTPPQDVVSDSSALSRCADSVLYVVKQDYVQKSQVINAITAMHQRGIKIDGCIFNGVPKFHRQYGYGYRYGYGYGYDYGYRKYSYSHRYGYGYSYRKDVSEKEKGKSGKSRRSSHKK